MNGKYLGCGYIDEETEFDGFWILFCKCLAGYYLGKIYQKYYNNRPETDLGGGADPLLLQMIKKKEESYELIDDRAYVHDE
jgi:hypothetical protein